MNAQVRPAEVMPQVVPMTVAALRLLDENGFFDGDANKYELIDGVLVMTPPPGTGHNYVELRASRIFNRTLMSQGLFDAYCVQTGGAFQIGEQTLLGPDMMVIPVPLEPTCVTADIVVVMIEISWSSRANDLGPKSKIYATANIADYWVLDVAARSVIVHRDPVDGVYTSVKTVMAPSSISCLKLPELTVDVADLF
jgi:Uma2 family endonuclease